MESKKVYVAGSTKEIPRVKKVQDFVRGKGWNITFDWTGAAGEIKTERPWVKGAEISTNEIRACQDADLTIVLCPVVSTGLGCWIELGATLASDKKVWIVEPQKDSVFWEHPDVREFVSEADLFEAIASA